MPKTRSKLVHALPSYRPPDSAIFTYAESINQAERPNCPISSIPEVTSLAGATMVEVSETVSQGLDINDLHLSCNSSDSNSTDTSNSEHLGIDPYQFEPYLSSDDEAQDAPAVEVDQTQADRIGSTEWCSCGFCQPMPTGRESVCCQELQRVTLQMEPSEDTGNIDFSCITLHPGFQPVCLDVFVLRTAYFTFRQQYNENIEESPDRDRYIAYRQFVRWCWGYLGRHNRVPLPSCVVSKIRATFPSDNVTGFLDS